MLFKFKRVPICLFIYSSPVHLLLVDWSADIRHHPTRRIGAVWFFLSLPVFRASFALSSAPCSVCRLSFICSLSYLCSGQGKWEIRFSQSYLDCISSLRRTHGSTPWPAESHRHIDPSILAVMTARSAVFARITGRANSWVSQNGRSSLGVLLLACPPKPCPVPKG